MPERKRFFSIDVFPKVALCSVLAFKKWTNLPNLRGNLGNARKKASFFQGPFPYASHYFCALNKQHRSKIERYVTNDTQTSILSPMQSKSTIKDLRTLSSHHIQHAFIIPSFLHKNIGNELTDCKIYEHKTG